MINNNLDNNSEKMQEKKQSNQNNNFKSKCKFFIKRQIYEFQYYLSKGVKTQIIFLTVLTIAVSFLFGVVLIILNAKSNEGNSLNIFEAMWQSFLHTIDTGAIQAENDFTFRAVALFITLIGVFIFSALISVLTTGLDKYFVELRKGKTEIIDKDFTLILGWSPTIFKILEEKVLANANHKGNHIVILANIDKIKMEDEIAIKVNQTELINKVYKEYDKKYGINKNKKYYQTQIITRTGDPIDLDDLKIVNPQNAKSIIILPTDNNLSDSYVIKCALALDGMKITQKVITEIKLPSNKRAIEISLKTKLKNKIFIPANDWLSKITAQTSRQSGYSLVLTEILNYENNEIYFKAVAGTAEDKNTFKFNTETAIVGKTFEELYFACKNAILIGIVKKNLDETNLKDKIRENIIINPFTKTPKDCSNRKIEIGDELIVLQYDDDPTEFEFKNFPQDRIGVSEKTNIDNYEKQNILIIGWNSRIETIIKELYDYISFHSEIIIVKEKKHKEKEEELKQNLKKFINQKNNDFTPVISIFEADTTDFESLVEYFKYPSKTLEGQRFVDNLYSIIVLGYDNIHNIQERDAKTILTLLHLHTLQEKFEKYLKSEFNIVAEIYDEKNRAIVEISDTCDYIISENIISSMMTQLSEDELIFNVFEELFDSEGCEIYLKPANHYFEELETQAEITKNFYEILQKVSEFNEITLGYRLKENAGKADDYGMVVNPVNKEKQITLKKEDKIIVLSSNDDC